MDFSGTVTSWYIGNRCRNLYFKSEQARRIAERILSGVPHEQKCWVSIILDDTLADREIQRLIADSHKSV